LKGILVAKTPKSTKTSEDQEALDNATPATDRPQDDIEDAEVIGETSAGGPAAAGTPWTSGGAVPPRDIPEPATEDAASEAPTDAIDLTENAPEGEATEAAEEEVLLAEGEVSEPETGPKDDAADNTPTPPPAGAQRGASGFAGLVAGGLIAGILGFGAAQYANGGWPFATGDDPVGEAMTAQNTRIEDLSAQLAAAESEIATLQSDTSAADSAGQLQSSIDGLESSLSEATDQIAALTGRVDALEKMAPGDSAAAAEAAAAAYERELADMRAMLDAELAKIQDNQAAAEELQAQAAENAQAASARAALSRIMAALDTGQPFGDSLFDLTTATDTEAPPALAAVADEGVPTLGALQEAFPDAARAALDAAVRQAVADGTMGRGEAFLRVQLGTRSLEPKEGDDPDAILSRAEAYLHNGRLDDALTEVASLPEAAQPAMADWVAMAETRRDAIAAGSALADSLNQ
jgi:hypothetical protein